MEKAIKYHKFASFGIALGFLIVVQRFATPEPIFRFLVPAFLLLLIIVSLYNNWYLKQIQKFNVWTLLRPVLTLSAAFGLFFIIPGEITRGLFLISAVFIIMLSEFLISSNSETLFIVEILLNAFGLFFTLAAFLEYAPSFGILFVIGAFISGTILTRVFYEPVPNSSKNKIVAAIVIGIFCAQIFWTLSFLPFHYSAVAFILFSIFYFCLIANYYNFFHILTFKKIQFHLLLILCCLMAVVFSTPWSIIK